MDIIPQLNTLFDNITQINKFCYIIRNQLEPLALVKKVPDCLLDQISDPIFLDKIEKLNSSLKDFKEISDPIGKSIQKAISEAKQFVRSSENDMQEYADFKVDEVPITTKLLKPVKSFEEIIQEKLKNGLKPIKEVKSRNGAVAPCSCPFCKAPNSYIYDNNKRGQWLCKVCTNTFTIHTTNVDKIGYFCPYCECKLQKTHERSNYDVYKCPNVKCSFYLDNLKKLTTDEKNSLKTSSDQFKLHFTHRDFHIDFNEVKNENLKFNTKVNLSRIRVSQAVLGLILTYRINYGLSARKVVNILRDVHQVKISHQSIMNYCEAVVPYVQGLVDKYEYKLSNEIAGDETYVKIRGKNKYVFFFSDTKTKVILAYRIFDNRDTLNAVKSIYMAISKYKDIPEGFQMITDANPIYNAAQVFFDLQGIKYTLHQVIGVSNKDEESIKYRSYKQIEERLNRTFKENYHGMNGFDNIRTANVYMVLYATFFNFLRRHSSLGYKVPQELNIFEENETMMNKWLKLIQFGIKYAY